MLAGRLTPTDYYSKRSEAPRLVLSPILTYLYTASDGLEIRRFFTYNLEFCPPNINILSSHAWKVFPRMTFASVHLQLKPIPSPYDLTKELHLARFKNVTVHCFQNHLTVKT
ncbi:hypothetical protein E2C01_054492 [Portunus trituberculatus]|uniref:Uncharacterized protein n=1 Tax=Portunus trituberculatus TaxID=210409 RepID=A0A5B7GTC3_PORTR|nr:hypothetical protein [Portunus trituberculatus]